MKCNELLKTGKAGQNTIEYRFVSTDGNTPSRAAIRLGDTDPATGTPIEDIGFFRKYNSIRNSQAYYNGRNNKAWFTKEEEKAREALRVSIAAAFERDYGYAPNRETLYCLLEEKWPTPYNVSFEGMIDEDESAFEKYPEFEDRRARMEFPGEESEDTEALREFAGSLTGRLADVFAVMLEKAGGGAESRQWLDLAERWNVSPSQITKDQKKLIRMIREFSANVRRFSYDR